MVTYLAVHSTVGLIARMLCGGAYAPICRTGETVAEARASKVFGWVVEVTRATPATTLQFNVAEPAKAQAVEAVRRRIPEAAGAKVEAKTPLSGHTVYGLLRMKRGQVAKIG